MHFVRLNPDGLSWGCVLELLFLELKAHEPLAVTTWNPATSTVGDGELLLFPPLLLIQRRQSAVERALCGKALRAQSLQWTRTTLKLLRVQDPPRVPQLPPELNDSE